MAFVVDASVTAAWILPDEESPLASLVRSLLADEAAFAPFVWWLEVRNLLLVAERRRRVSGLLVDQLLGALNTYPISLDTRPDERRVVELARTHALTIYDASYIELAGRLGLPLATLDGKLARAAASEDVPLVIATSR